MDRQSEHSTSSAAVAAFLRAFGGPAPAPDRVGDDPDPAVVLDRLRRAVLASVPPEPGPRGLRRRSAPPCAQVPARLADRAVGTLAAGENEALMRHMATCPRCASLADRLDRAEQAFAMAVRAPASQDTEDTGASPWLLGAPDGAATVAPGSASSDPPGDDDSAAWVPQEVAAIAAATVPSPVAAAETWMTGPQTTTGSGPEVWNPPRPRSVAVRRRLRRSSLPLIAILLLGAAGAAIVVRAPSDVGDPAARTAPLASVPPLADVGEADAEILRQRNAEARLRQAAMVQRTEAIAASKHAMNRRRAALSRPVVAAPAPAIRRQSTYRPPAAAPRAPTTTRSTPTTQRPQAPTTVSPKTPSTGDPAGAPPSSKPGREIPGA